MFRSLALLAATAVAAQAADTPQQTYEHKVACASLWAAAQADAHDKVKANQDAQTVRDAAVAAGRQVGVPAARVTQEIDRRRDRLLADIHQPDPVKAKKANNEAGGALFACGLGEVKSGELRRK